VIAGDDMACIVSTESLITRAGSSAISA